MQGSAAPQAGVCSRRPGDGAWRTSGCCRSVVRAFMANLGIRFRGEVLVDDLDARRDLRDVPGLGLRVRSTVLAALPAPGTAAHRDPRP